MGQSITNLPSPDCHRSESVVSSRMQFSEKAKPLGSGGSEINRYGTGTHNKITHCGGPSDRGYGGHFPETATSHSRSCSEPFAGPKTPLLSAQMPHSASVFTALEVISAPKSVIYTRL